MIELKTPSGYTVTIKRDYLTRAESLQIKEMNMKMIQSRTKLSDLEKNKDADIDLDFSLQLHINDKIFELLTVSLMTPEGQAITTDIIKYVNGLKESTGNEIVDSVINELNRKEEPVSGKKNSTAP